MKTIVFIARFTMLNWKPELGNCLLGSVEQTVNLFFNNDGALYRKNADFPAYMKRTFQFDYKLNIWNVYVLSFKDALRLT